MYCLQYPVNLFHTCYDVYGHNTAKNNCNTLEINKIGRNTLHTAYTIASMIGSFLLTDYKTLLAIEEAMHMKLI